MKPNDGGPAFPTDEENDGHELNYHHEGMSLRDWFAGQALNGSLSNHQLRGTHSDFSDNAYKFADAMLKAREATDGRPS